MPNIFLLTLQKTRKLSLVLDLDLTLLHASHDPRHSLVASLAPQEDAEEIHEFELGAHKFWVKLRPVSPDDLFLFPAAFSSCFCTGFEAVFATCE